MENFYTNQTSPCFTCIGGEKKGIAVPATREQWEEVRRSQRVSELSSLILDAQDEETQKMFKDQLPFWTPRCAGFLNNHRQQTNALKPLRRLMIDIDDEKGKTADIMAMLTPASTDVGRGFPSRKSESTSMLESTSESKSESLYIGQFEVLLIEESIRKGTHVLISLPEGMTPEEAQKEFAEAVGMKVDSSVKNVAGFIYQVPAENTKYLSEKLFEVEEALENEAGKAGEEETEANASGTVAGASGTVAGALNTRTETSGTVAGALNTGIECRAKISEPHIQAEAASQSKGDADSAHPSEEPLYQGFKMSDIISKYVELFWNGKEPEVGERNGKTFEFAVHFRSICDFSQQKVEAITPRWANFPEQEWRQTIANALKEPRKGVSYRINQVMAALRTDQKIQATGGTVQTAPTPPKRLPKLLKLLVSRTPSIAKVATLENIWAALATHIHGVKIRHFDGKLRDITFQHLLIGQQSVGKGYIVEPIEAILKDIKVRDAINRERENEYKRKNPAGAKKEKEPRPTDILIQCLSDNLTDAAFTQRVIDAEVNGQRYVYVRVDEVELLKKVTSSKKLEDVHLLMRKAFDNAEHGQERVGSDSVCGNAHLRWNFNASTTPVNAMSFMKRGLNDGTLSRLAVSTIIPSEDDLDDDIPVQGDYDQKFLDELKPYLQRLDTANGIIECKQATKLMKEINQECKKNGYLFDSQPYAILSKRAIVVGFMKAMLLYIANGYKWSKDIEEYVRWSVSYDLWCKMYYFGAELDKQISVERRLVKSNPQDILALLPESFSMQDYLNLRMQMGKEGDGKSTLRTWKHRDYIAEDPVTGMYVKLKKAA